MEPGLLVLLPSPSPARSRHGPMTEERQSEIKKLPRSICQRCKLEGPKPMVQNGACVNKLACDRRFDRLIQERDRRRKP
jgi:hypothetical protein